MRFTSFFQINDAASNVANYAIGNSVGFFVVFGFSSICASFVLLPVVEKEKKVSSSNVCLLETR